MSAASVFNLDVLTPTIGAESSSESHVLSLVTPNTRGPIQSAYFLQFASSPTSGILTSHSLQPGVDQALIRSDAQASYIYGNLSVFINPPMPAGSTTQPDAYSLTVGKDRQTMIQGVNFATGKNQTGWKEEFWDIQTSMNVDQVKVSYFVVNTTTQNSTATRFTFENETLIQWGNRLITRYGDTTNTTVADTVSVTSEGDNTQVNIGDLQIKNYGGANFELVNGGSNISLSAGAQLTYAEGLQFNACLGSGLDVHLFYLALQGMGMGGSLLKTTSVVEEYKNVLAQVQALPARIGKGLVTVLNGILVGTPRA